VAQAAPGDLLARAVEDEQGKQLRDRGADLRRVVAELQLATELEVGGDRRRLASFRSWRSCRGRSLSASTASGAE
jgi:hypothetical protein